ncbi:MAG: hypothetical protein J7K61_01755 [Thermoplasmata archaeon]|nr:hypothetical protein [Thermoplasmata archaeon]
MKIIALAIVAIISFQSVIAFVNTEDIPMRRGEYATGRAYGDNAEMEWLARFNIVHAGSIEEPLSNDRILYLRNSGVKFLIFDDWLPAGYYYLDGNNSEFMNWVYYHRNDATLNPDGPFPHCDEGGYTWMHEYYFDFAFDEVVNRRCDYIKNGMERYGYDGIFFDWGNGLFLEEPEYKEINATWHERHGNMEYSSAASSFIASLRNSCGNIKIINNQGFREARYYLPELDYDMTESYITGCEYYGKKLYVDGYGLVEVPQTVYYPVSENEFNGSIEDTLYHINYLESLKEEYGGKNFKSFIYMNYAAPEFVYAGRKENGYDVYVPTIPKNAIYFGYAMAKLVGAIEYTEVPWNHTYERCDVYFYDIGEPVGNSYIKEGNAYVRYYTNGFVIAGEWNKKSTVTLHSENIPSYAHVYDAFEGKWIESGGESITITITPHADELTGRMAPCGRVFVYEKARINVSIRKPVEGRIYFMDREIMPFHDTVIIGKITVEADSNGRKVEFYVDGALKNVDDEMPYAWQWDEFIMGRHIIMARAYDENGRMDEDSIEVFILNF